MDVLVDRLQLAPRAALNLQHRLIEALGLQHQATTFTKVARLVGDWFPTLSVSEHEVDLATVVGMMALGTGVVIGYRPNNAKIGHAVRLEAGEGLLQQRVGDPFVDDVLAETGRWVADIAAFEVHVFDPAPPGSLLRYTIPQLRPAYDNAGARALLIR